jgi:HJR/Mrr/RecB family endonuclease
MINEAALLESRTLRTSLGNRTEVLDKVKALSLLPDGMHVTTVLVATYFEVAERTINRLVQRHREELTENGAHVLKGAELHVFERDNLSLSKKSYPQGRAHLTLYPRRAVLNIAMLLRDSEVARQVRAYLLDIESLVRPRYEPAPAAPEPMSLDDHIDLRLARILGKTVVPLFNALIESSGEQRLELISLREDIQRIERKIVRHDVRLLRLERAQEQRGLAGVIASLDAMGWREFEQHIAGLLRRDGCTDVRVLGGSADRGVDITGRTADGRTVAVQCKHFAPHRSVWSGELQKFLGAAKVQHGADVALYVATCSFSREALAIAAEFGVTSVHRGLLESWSAGAQLQVLRQ